VICVGLQKYQQQKKKKKNQYTSVKISSVPTEWQYNGSMDWRIVIFRYVEQSHSKAVEPPILTVENDVIASSIFKVFQPAVRLYLNLTPKYAHTNVNFQILIIRMNKISKILTQIIRNMAKYSKKNKIVRQLLSKTYR